MIAALRGEVPGQNENRFARSGHLLAGPEAVKLNLIGKRNGAVSLAHKMFEHLKVASVGEMFVRVQDFGRDRVELVFSKFPVDIGMHIGFGCDHEYCPVN